MSETPFTELMRGLRNGNADTAREVFDRFSRRLIGLAATHLPQSLRGKTDPESVVQSALGSFFARHAEGQFDLADWDELWNLLTVITVRKCGHRLERFTAGKRSVNRERPLAASAEDSTLTHDVADPAPTPLEAALFRETVEELFRQTRPRDQEILRLRLEGHRVREIAERVGRSERTVERTLEQARDYLLAQGGEEEGLT